LHSLGVHRLWKPPKAEQEAAKAAMDAAIAAGADKYAVTANGCRTKIMMPQKHR